MELNDPSFPRTARAFYEQFLARFKTFSDEDLIDAFNEEVAKAKC